MYIYIYIYIVFPSSDELSEMRERLPSNTSECEENLQEKIKQLTASYELQLETLKQGYD